MRFYSLLLAIFILFPSLVSANPTLVDLTQQSHLQAEFPEKETEKVQKDKAASEIVEDQGPGFFPIARREYKSFIGDDKIERISGSNRYQTSVAISEALLITQSMVIVASGENFPDALAGSNLVLGTYPILLTPSDRLAIEVKEEIQRLNPEKIVVLGGLASVSQRVEEELTDLAPVERLAGRNRFETAAEIAKMTGKADILLTAGNNFPDALAAAGLSYVQGQNILLTTGDVLDPAVKSYLQYRDGQVDLVGGEDVVGLHVLQELKALNHAVNDRFAGSNRFATSVAIAEEIVKDRGGIRAVIIANGGGYADALSASLLSQNQGAPILLVGSDTIDPSVVNFLDKYRDLIDKALIIGGVDSVSEGLAAYIEQCIVDGGTKPTAYLPLEALQDEPLDADLELDGG